MSEKNPIYDLVLLLDPATDDTQQAKILADAKQAITAGGEIVSEHDWGLRKLAYEIIKKPEAIYHLVQFHSGSPALLEQLDRSLRITDGVLRHRIVKLAPGTPEPKDLRAVSADAPVATEDDDERETASA